MRTVQSMTWDEALADCAKPSPWRSSYSTDGASSIWYGSPTYSDAMAIARDGWSDGRDKIARGLALAPTTHRQSTTFLDVAGAYPVAALAAAGDPACMVAHGEIEAPRGIVRIVVGGACSANTTPNQIINRGVAVCSVIDAIEASGRRAELVVTFTAREKDHTYVWNVTLKDADQPLELDRVAFALAHPSMQRRLGLRHVERHYSENDWHKGYGRPAQISPADHPDSVIVQTITAETRSRFDTPTSAAAAMVALFTAQGVDVTPDA